MPEADGLPLSFGPENLVDQTSDAVHLDQRLDILLLTEPLKCQIEFFMLPKTVLDPLRAIQALFDAAAGVVEDSE